MTPDEQRLAFTINSAAPGQQSISPGEFLSLTGIPAPQEWALGELQTAIDGRNPDDVEAALVVAAIFGMDTRWSGPLASLLQVEWHELHEDVALALKAIHSLGKIRGNEAESALRRLLDDPDPEFRETTARVL